MSQLFEVSKEFIDTRFKEQSLKMLVGGKYSLPIYNLFLKEIEMVTHYDKKHYQEPVNEYIHTFLVNAEKDYIIKYSILNDKSLNPWDKLYIKEGLFVGFNSEGIYILDPLREFDKYRKREFNPFTEEETILTMRILNFLLVENYTEFFLKNLETKVMVRS